MLPAGDFGVHAAACQRWSVLTPCSRHVKFSKGDRLLRLYASANFDEAVLDEAVFDSPANRLDSSFINSVKSLPVR